MSKKKRQKIASVIFIVVVIIVSVTTYINRFNDTKLKELETALEINEYLTSFSLLADDNKEIIKHNGLKVYPYRAVAYTRDSFLSLSDEEKLEELGNVAVEIDKFIGMNTYIDCGKNKYCDIDEIMVLNPDGDSESYTIGYEKDKNIENYTMEVTNNENGNFETETVSSDSSNNSDNSTETSSSPSDSPIVEITHADAEISGNYITVKGSVKNNSNSAKTFIEVKVSYFNDNGDFLDTETSYINSSDALLPGEQKSFNIMSEMVGEKYTKYKVQVGQFSD